MGRECRWGNGARGSPREIRRRQWEALTAGIISRGSPREIWRKQWEVLTSGIISRGEAHEAGR
jgi:hypothetical protein